jgi:hypothetical protein
MTDSLLPEDRADSIDDTNTNGRAARSRRLASCDINASNDPLDLDV